VLSRSGIQPTYEELKHVILDEEAGKLLGIQPTYEELKQRNSLPSAAGGLSIQPTYEELKQRSFFFPDIPPGMYPAYL